MSYPSLLEGDDAALAADKAALTALVKSFKPLPDVYGAREKIEAEAAKNLQETIQQAGVDMFGFELKHRFQVNLHDLDVKDPDKRDSAVKWLRPFRQLARYVGVEADPSLAPLWLALEQAEIGNATPLAALLEEAAAPPPGPPEMTAGA